MDLPEVKPYTFGGFLASASGWLAYVKWAEDTPPEKRLLWAQ